MSDKNTRPAACSEQVITITAADLPLCCPRPNERLWDAHPRVYIEMPASGEAVCPYCGTRYILADS